MGTFKFLVESYDIPGFGARVILLFFLSITHPYMIPQFLKTSAHSASVR